MNKAHVQKIRQTILYLGYFNQKKEYLLGDPFSGFQSQGDRPPAARGPVRHRGC